MTSAILEILGLLGVALLIGIFFTRRYWKSKLDEVELILSESREANSQTQRELRDCQGELAEAQQEVKTLKNEVSDLQSQVASSSGLQKELDGQKAELSKKNEEVERLNKEVTGLQSKVQTTAAADNKEVEREEALKKAKAETKKTTDQLKEAKGEIKGLYEEIELLREDMAAQDREIDAIRDELEKRKISYYKQIDGKRYKALTLRLADESVAGKGDGRISKADAEKIFETISDGKAYTQVEKDTMRYLRDHYNWTDEADALFRTKVRSWAAKGHELD